MDWPIPTFRSLPVLNPWHPEAMGYQASNGVGLAATSSRTWTVTDEAQLYPFRLGYPETITKLWIYNGATVSGNFDIGIYDAEGTRIVSAGSTAQAGTNAVQSVDITDTLLGPGIYYMALVFDNTTATLFADTGWASVRAAQQSGLCRVASAFALPATVTLTTSNLTTGIYLFGCLFGPRTVI